MELKAGLNLPKADWIFFLSPSGVSLFSSQFDAESYKIGVIGPGTEREVRNCGWRVDFAPKSTDPKEGIEEFANQLPTTETVIMACSDKSLKRMHGLIAANQLIEWEFYRNKPKKHPTKTEAQYVIFTSPSNANAYLDHHVLDTTQVAVAIGKSTEGALKTRQISNFIRATHPTEESMWEAILMHRRFDTFLPV